MAAPSLFSSLLSGGGGGELDKKEKVCSVHDDEDDLIGNEFYFSFLLSFSFFLSPAAAKVSEGDPKCCTTHGISLLAFCVCVCVCLSLSPFGAAEYIVVWRAKG